MPRPTKCRRICEMPSVIEFAPTAPNPAQVVIMTVDEYETIRLIDAEQLSQEACSASMQIARTTVQQIYNSARKKLAQVLVEGCALRIEGGEYRLCDGQERFHGCGGCRRKCHHTAQNKKA